MASNIPSIPSTSTATEFDVNLENLTYVVSNIDTVIALLASKEDDIIKRSLEAINKLWMQQPHYKKFVMQKGLHDKLEYTIQSDNLMITRLTLRILTEMYNSPDLIEQVGVNPSLNFIKRLMDLFAGHSDEIVKEHSLFILLAFAKDEQVCTYMFNYGLACSIFDVLKLVMDPDIQVNSLMLFDLLLDVPDIETFFQSPNKYTLKLLLCYLKSEYFVIREIAVKILIKMSTFRSAAIEAKMIKDGIITTMFTYLMDENKANFHPMATSIILNTIESKAICEHFAQSQIFVQFVEFVKFCPDEFAIFVARVLDCVSQYEDLLQILQDYNTEVSVLHLFRFADPIVRYHICRCLKNMSKHRIICEKILTGYTLKSLLDISIIPEYESEYRVAALQAIYNFMKKDVKTMDMFFKLEGVDKIKALFIEIAPNLRNDEVDCILSILYMYCSLRKYAEKLNTEDFCKVLLQQLEQRDAENVLINLLENLNCFSSTKIFCEYFITCSGMRIVVNKIQRIAGEDVLKRMLVFVYNTMMNQKIAISYLKGRLFQQLETIPQNVCESIPILKRIMNKLYSLYLPLKFHKKGRLELEDKLHTGFYVIDGEWNQEFPFLDVLIKGNISNAYTIYLINYTATMKLMRMSQSANTVISKIRRRGSFRRRSSSDTNRLRRQRTVSKQPVLPSISEISAPTPITYIVAKIANLLRYSDKSLDPYLADLVQSCSATIYDQKNAALCINHKVKVLARCVDAHQSGFFPEANSRQFDYHHKMHVKCVKKQLFSNIVPIGCIRHGGHVERSLLFKAIADKVGVPSALVRGSNGLVWNEVPMNVMSHGHLVDSHNTIIYGVVDLMRDIGNIMPVESEAAKEYCRTKAYLMNDLERGGPQPGPSCSRRN